jgi:hypothetical protein
VAKIHPKQREKVADLLRAAVPVTKAAKRARMSAPTARVIGYALGLILPRPKKPPKPPRPPRPPAQPKEPKPEGRRRGVAPWQHRLALAMLRDGASCLAVAESVGICASTAARLARLYGVTVRPRGVPKGSRGVPMVLREAALRMVRDGCSLAKAGAAVGVSRQRVHQWAQAEGVVVGNGRKPKAKAGAPGRHGVTLARAAEFA